MYKQIVQKLLFAFMVAVYIAPVRAQEAALANQAIQMVSQQSNELIDSFVHLPASVKNFVLNVLAFRLKPHPSITTIEEGEKITQSVYALIEQDQNALEFFRTIFKEIERAINPLMDLFNDAFEREKEQNKDEQALYQLFMQYNQKLMELNQICLSIIYEKLYNAAAEEDNSLLLESINELGQLIENSKANATKLPTLQEIAQQINDFIAAQTGQQSA